MARRRGQTLTRGQGARTGSPTSYAYQWQRCDSAGANCVDIRGATSTTYVTSDIGKTIRVVETATKGGGSTSATSAQTAVVADSTALDVTGCTGTDLAFGNVLPPDSVTTGSDCRISFSASGGQANLRVYQQDTTGRAMSGPGTVLDYGEAGGTWAGTTLFGACLRASTNATNTWTVSATCPASDGAYWNDVPTAADTVATAADGVTGSVDTATALKSRATRRQAPTPPRSSTRWSEHDPQQVGKRPGSDLKRHPSRRLHPLAPAQPVRPRSRRSHRKPPLLRPRSESADPTGWMAPRHGRLTSMVVRAHARIVHGRTLDRRRAREGARLRHPFTSVAVTAFACLWFATSASALPSTPSDSWITDADVRASALSSDGSLLYIGGNFSYVGPRTGSWVGVSDTSGTRDTTWPEVSGGQIRASISDGAGGWYIGGSFTHVDHQPRSRIAHITSTGALDATFNPGADNTVTELALSGTTLYLGGSFLNVGGQARSRLAAVDTGTGAVTGWNPSAGGAVEAMLISGTTVYVGGSFTTAGGQTRNRLAAIDASTGNATAWDPSVGSTVYDLELGTGVIYAAGSFTTVGGLSRTRLAEIDLSTAAPSAWNPTAGSTVWQIELSGSTLYVGGAFTTLGGQTRNRIGAVDTSSGLATAWDPNASSTVYTIHVTASNVYAGGAFTTIGGQSRRYLAAIDRTSAAATAWDPTPENWVRAISTEGSAVFFGGDFNSIGGQLRTRLAAIDTATGEATSWNPGANNWVYTLAVSGSTIYAGGTFTSIGGQLRNRLAALDASTGAATAWDPNPGAQIDAVVATASTVYAAGTFTSIGGQLRNRIAALDATTAAATAWDPNANAQVKALVLDGTTLYAGGYFTSIGGQARNYIAALDTGTGLASAWDPAAGASVHALALSGTTMYAGGYFLSMGGQTRNRIAAVDTGTGAVSAWDPNANSAVLSLAAAGTAVYAGGSFTTIGGQTRNYLAEIDASTGSASAWDPAPSTTVWTLVPDGSSLYIGGAFVSVSGGAYWQEGIAFYSTTCCTSVAAPTNTTAPSISGTTTEGQTLTRVQGTWTGSPTSYSYQWRRCTSSTDVATCTNISGATSTTYLLASADVGNYIRVDETATNAGGSATATSAATAVVSAPAPTNSTLPSISGTTTEGQTLTRVQGTWTGSPTSYAYQWQRCDSAGSNCVNISGATGTTYVLTTSDIGKTIRVVETATNAGGSTSATSAQTAVVADSTTLDVTGCAGTDLAFGNVLPPDSVTTGSDCTISFSASGGQGNLRVYQQDTTGRAMSGPASVLDYGETGGTWAGTSLFGACLKASTNATNTWTASATCPTTDGTYWNDIPTAADTIATAADGITGSVDIRYGIKIPSSQAPGAYSAAIVYEVVRT